MARVTIAYNEPEPSRYDTTGEVKAVAGVLEAVSAVKTSLLELGHDVTILPLKLPFEEAKAELSVIVTDLVFNLFEGFCGYPETEAMVPQILSQRGIPYTGCPVKAISLALDKPKTKAILAAAGMNTPRYQVLEPGSVSEFRLNYPCIVKPAAEDASHGLTPESFVNDFAALKKQVEVISECYGGRALVEEFLNGREFNATVLGNGKYTVLPISEITYTLPPGLPRILTYAAKWESDNPYYWGTPVVCPAELSLKEKECVQETALTAFKLTGCRGYARVDMRMDDMGRLNVIEVNPNPDISPGSGAARQAVAAGWSYTQFIEHLVNLALVEDW